MVLSGPSTMFHPVHRRLQLSQSQTSRVSGWPPKRAAITSAVKSSGALCPSKANQFLRQAVAEATELLRQSMVVQSFFSSSSSTPPADRTNLFHVGQMLL